MQQCASTCLLCAHPRVLDTHVSVVMSHARQRLPKLQWLITCLLDGTRTVDLFSCLMCSICLNWALVRCFHVHFCYTWMWLQQAQRQKNIWIALYLSLKITLEIWLDMNYSECQSRTATKHTSTKTQTQFLAVETCVGECQIYGMVLVQGLQTNGDSVNLSADTGAL